MAVSEEAVKKLIYMMGSPATCKQCQQKFFWIKTKNGKNVPIDENAEVHFNTCPKRDIEECNRRAAEYNKRREEAMRQKKMQITPMQPQQGDVWVEPPPPPMDENLPF